MHPAVISQLAQQRRSSQAARAGQLQLAAAARRPGHSRPSAAGFPLPRVRLTWTQTTLAMADGARRRRSWVLVISATRSS